MRLMLFILILTSLAWSKDQDPLYFLNTKQQAAFQNSDLFLTKLGFEDYVTQIKKNRESGEKVSAISNLALDRSSEYLQSINGARNLANLTFAILKG